MAALRRPRIRLVASILVGLAGLLAFVSSAAWIVALAAAPDTMLFAVPFLGAALASLAVAVAIPLTRLWQPPRWAQFALPVVIGLFALVAAGGLWVILSLVLCGTDGVCRPADTWRALPGLLACGILTAAGPGLGALLTREEWRDRLWVVAAVIGVLGVGAALVAWVEFGIYPLS